MTNILIVAFGEPLLLAALAWLCRELISARLKAAITHEYDLKLASQKAAITHDYGVKLESLKAQLGAENKTSIVELKAEIERDATLLAMAHGAFSEGQKASTERRLAGIDRLWGSVVHLHRKLPVVLTLLDVVTEKDLDSLKDNADFNQLAAPLTEANYVALVSSIASDDGEPVELERPYVGEYMWAIYSSNQAILLRAALLLRKALEDPSKLHWHSEPATRGLITSVLSPEELRDFDRLEFGKISWLRQNLEWKLLSAARNMISGKQFGNETLEQARLIQQRVAEMNRPSVKQAKSSGG